MGIVVAATGRRRSGTGAAGSARLFGLVPLPPNTAPAVPAYMSSSWLQLVALGCGGRCRPLLCLWLAWHALVCGTLWSFLWVCLVLRSLCACVSYACECSALF